ncbi:Crp/Fnr family transcriptional regulator [Chryseotalea sanaruensis]|uniref:Crp/Fnr family transcriptional regulator n=1 Tax=Chryseotalea sanaruensis TaxID=2482724 RepID=A0A401UEU7_9BACT|nr:Crp/Fnr family transcriptional regulator [Chryseotalea sanaruensis]GCC53426.1 Crp/Fnr family transcriptional regulator [Chryseotalea sanaruensis]
MQHKAIMVLHNYSANPDKITKNHDESHKSGRLSELGLVFRKKMQAILSDEIIKQYSAQLIQVKKGQILFNEGDNALYFFQIRQGSVKMVSYSDEGQEFIQGVFSDAESFGEPALLGDFVYPSSAIAIKDSTLWRLSKNKFFDMLKENFEIHLALDRTLCKRLKYKNLVLSEISFHDPEHRLKSLLKHLRDSLTANNKTDHFELPFTRQQLADMCGMRVETVIRTVKKLKDNGDVQVRGHKIIL